MDKKKKPTFVVVEEEVEKADSKAAPKEKKVLEIEVRAAQD